MTIHKTAYSTTICDGFRMERTLDAIREANIREYMQPFDSCIALRTTRGAIGAVPAFNHPIYLGEGQRHTIDNHNGPLLAVDLRPACRTDRRAGQIMSSSEEFSVINTTLYKARLYRGALNSVWIQQGPAALRSITPMAMSVFASWVSETLGRRYGLDPRTQYDLMILAAIFYSSNHVDGLEFDKMVENRQLAAISTSLKVSVEDVIKAYDTTKLILSTEDFCNKVKNYLNNIRLEELNTAILVQLMAGTWYGDNAPENAAVALEHPPTWLALLLEAYTNTAMKRSNIARICERRQYHEGLEQLVRAVKALAPDTTQEVSKLR